MIIIVNADDLGANERVNNEIFDLMQSGAITSASLMANTPGFEHAVQQIPRFPQCSFGVHLNLTAFPPLSSATDLEPILDESGHLSKKLFTVPITSKLRKALLLELTLQVQRVLDAGVPVSHFDSHNHVHTIPQLFQVLKSLQRRFAIRKVRTTINLLPPGQQMTGLRSIKKIAYRLALRHSYKTTSPDGLGDFRDFYKILNTGQVPRFRCLELMVHPGIPNPKYSDEVAAVRSNWQALLPPDIKIGSYHSL
ncbi:MAG: ChbG/HpnK family deacetylase [Terracidiphilus sp.]